MNNLETMRTHVQSLPTTLRYFERTQFFIDSGDPVLTKFGTDCEAIFVQSLANGEKMLNDRIVESLDKLVKKVICQVWLSVPLPSKSFSADEQWHCWLYH